MPQNIPTTFVPRAPLASPTVSRPQVTRVNILGIVGGFALLLAVGASVALFLYQSYLSSEVTRRSGELRLKEDAIPEAQVAQLAATAVRMRVVQELLDQHVAPSRLLAFLERQTVEGVAFEDAVLSETPTGDFEARLKGTARSFESLAFQSSVLAIYAATTTTFTVNDQIFSDITINERTGAVGFSFTGLLPRETLVGIDAGFAGFTQDAAATSTAEDDAALDAALDDLDL